MKYSMTLLFLRVLSIGAADSRLAYRGLNNLNRVSRNIRR